MDEEREPTFWELIVAKLLELWAESVVTQSLITMALVFSACYLWVTDRQVPQELYLILGTIIGWFFGSKSQHALQLRAQEAALSRVRLEAEVQSRRSVV